MRVLAPESTASKHSSFTRRAFLTAASAAAVGLGFDAGELERHSLVVERRTFALENLPAAFEGLRIAQLSDLHYAEFTEPFFLRRAIEDLNALHPDMVLLTGDFVSMDPVTAVAARAYAPLCAKVLAGIRCPERYASIGNHDWVVGQDAVAEALRSVGIRVLINQYVPLERGGARLWLAGLGSALGSDLNLPATIPPHALGDREPVVMMAHEPDIWEMIAPYGVDLVLSGHTHAGQVRLPFTRPLFLPPLGERYVNGHFRQGRSQLYVNRGLGTVGLPFRFRCPPELTLITLERA